MSCQLCECTSDIACSQELQSSYIGNIPSIRSRNTSYQLCNVEFAAHADAAAAKSLWRFASTWLAPVAVSP